MANAKFDENRVPTLIGVSSVDLETPTLIAVNPTTGAILIDGDSLYTSLDTRYLKLDTSNDPITGQLDILTTSTKSLNISNTLSGATDDVSNIYSQVSIDDADSYSYEQRGGYFYATGSGSKRRSIGVKGYADATNNDDGNFGVWGEAPDGFGVYGVTSTGTGGAFIATNINGFATNIANYAEGYAVYSPVGKNKLGGNTGIGQEPALGKLEIKAPTTTTPSQTMTYVSGGNTFTTSSSLTLYEGDIVLPTTGGARPVRITTTATGTTFDHSTMPWSASATNSAFTVYHPSMRIYDYEGNRIMDVRPLMGTYVNKLFVGNVTENNGTIVNFENNTTLHWSNSTLTGVNTFVTVNNGLITFGGGFSMGNQSITTINSISGVTNTDFTINSLGTGKILLSPSNGAGVLIYGGAATAQLTITSSAITFANSINITGGVNISTGNAYSINAVSVLNATTLGSSVVDSSLTSVGTLSSLTVSGNITNSTLSVSSAVYTDGSKNLTSTAPSSGAIGYWSRSGTTLSPTTSGDSVTTSGNILTSGSGYMDSASSYKIATTNVLTSTTLGSGIVTSSLTTVGALASGSIASGFGTIATANTISTSSNISTTSTGTITSATTVIAGNGAVGGPAFTFSADTTSGVFRRTTGELNFSVTNTEILRMTVSNSNFLKQVQILGSANSSASSPSLYFASDSNTGIFSSGADAFNITTGGTERVRFDANGNVGIGQTTITAALHLKAGTTAASTAPIKLASGSLQTTAEAGTYEYNGNHYKTTAGIIRFSIGGTIFDHAADGGNTTTTETDLYSDTLAANTFNVNNDKVQGMYGGIFVSSATATRQIKVYFAGTAILDTGTLSISTSSSWSVNVLLIRVSSTVVRYTVALQTAGASTAVYNATGELTSLTLSGTNILKITGQAAGVGAATNDIVAKLGTIQFMPAI